MAAYTMQVGGAIKALGGIRDLHFGKHCGDSLKRKGATIVASDRDEVQFTTDGNR